MKDGDYMSSVIETDKSATFADSAYRTRDEIERLVRAFEDCTLPRAEWTHRAHLTVALWYIFHHSGEEAIISIRGHIKRYNAAHGVLMTRDSGYHETITLFWTYVVGRFVLLEGAGFSLLELANNMIKRFDNSRLPFDYYSRDRLMSWLARTSWVEPDLKPLD